MPQPVKTALSKRLSNKQKPRNPISRQIPKYASAGSNPVSRADTSALGKFECAIDDPFCEASYGAKVPDEYIFPTEATTLRHRFSVSPGAAAGGQYVVCTPHPQVGSFTVSTDATSFGLSAISGFSGSHQVNSVATNLQTIGVASPVGPTTLQTISSSYRVVGWGVRLRNTTQAQSVTGDVVVAVLPTTGVVPTSFANLLGVAAAVANPGAQWQELVNYASLPTNSYSALNQSYGAPKLNNLEALSSAEVYTSAELAQTGGILIRPKLHCPGAAYKFRPTKSTASSATGTSAGTGVLLLSATQGGTGTAFGSFDPDVLDTSGHNAVVISFSSVAAVQTFEVEVIYHLETVPLANTTSGVVPTSVQSSPRVPPLQFLQRLHKALSGPWFDFIKREGPGMLSSMQNVLPGLMTRAAMLALG